MTKKFKIVTLGCRTNQYESQAYASQLTALGYQPASDDESADVCVVNTCTVTSSADSSSRHSIRSLARENPGAEILVTGCLAERSPEELLQIPGVKHVVSNKEKENLLSKIFPHEDLPEFSITQFEGHQRAFVKVQDGCNSFCTYCIIPYVRGRSRSRRLEDVLNEIRGLIERGFKEVVLTGINIGDFDGNPGPGEKPVRLADLIRAVDDVPGLKRLRVSSIDPDEVDDDLIDAIVNGKTTCPSMHIVLQAGSNAVLKRMNRKYTRQIFYQTIDKLLTACPTFTFTTDVIVGFPGETEEDFAQTLQAIEDVQFAKVHMFPYSERPKTRAALYPNKVPLDVIQTRKAEVLQASERAAFNLRKKFLNSSDEVLIESEDLAMPGYLFGHTRTFLPVFVPKNTIEINEIYPIQLVENQALGFMGKAVTHAH